MRNLVLYIIYLFGFLLVFSQEKMSELVKRKMLLKEISNIDKDKSIQKDIFFWKKKLNLSKFSQDPIVKAKINYYIAKSFAPINMDSAEYYAVKALNVLEKYNGYENEKTMVYNGLGNIASVREQIYLASFYYNRATAIIETDLDENISNKNKSMFYLHSAQANFQTGLIEKAYRQNQQALPYTLKVIDNDYLKFRNYSQLFISGLFNGEDNQKLKIYLDKAENFVSSDKTRRYYNEHKAQLFESKSLLDSAKLYFTKVLTYDKSEPLTEVTMVNIFNTYCNLLVNATQRKDITEAQEYIVKIDKLKADNNIQNFEDSKGQVYLKGLKDYYFLIADYDNYQAVTKELIQHTEKMHQKAQHQAIEEMSSMYQLKAKEKSIENLSSVVQLKNNQLQITKIVLIIATLLSVIIFIYFYFKRKNKALQQQADTVILQQKLLRTQMEPHFIFNTLSTLQSLIRFDDKKKSIKYLNQFSRLLRNSLEMSRQDWTVLEEEIETLISYINLQQMRFEDLFNYKISIEDHLDKEAVMIPPMLIQPFVENSILHGFKGEPKEWLLEIKIQKLNENLLQIIVMDNGVGFDKRNVNLSNKSFSGAIAKERLEILAKKNKSKAQYKIETSKDIGTTVKLQLPFR